MTGFVNNFCLFILVLNMGCVIIARGQIASSTTNVPPVTSDTPNRGADTTPQPLSTDNGGGGQTETTDYDYYTTSVAAEAYKKLTNCSTPQTLENYCDGGRLTPGDLGYFHGNGSTSVTDILFRVINSTVVEALQKQCVPGNWCLADSYLQVLSEGKNAFYASPLCRSNSLWKCLLSIGPFRENCNENELLYLTSTLSLMCDIDVIAGMKITTPCYSRTLEAVHVLYSDLTRTVQISDEQKKCDYRKRITHTYDCAMATCNQQQRVFLNDFGPWTLVDTVTRINPPSKCNFSLQCPNLGAKQTVTPLPSVSSTNNPASALEKALDNKEASEENKINDKISEIQALDETEQAIEKIEEALDGDDSTTGTNAQQPQLNDGSDQGMDTPIYGSSKEDQTFVYGMVTVSIVAVVGFLLIGILTFKQISKRRKNYKLGYSQVTEEESRMLKSEYN